MDKDVEYVLFNEKQIAERVEALSERLCARYAGKNPVVVCILKGSVPFFVDLTRRMQIPLQTEFMGASSYGDGTRSGTLKITKDLGVDIRGREVLLVEDIIDSGNTLSRLKETLLQRQPASLEIVTLLDKPARRQAQIQSDYTGFVIEDVFVVGYGLDYAERYRNLPYVGVLRPSVYEK